MKATRGNEVQFGRAGRAAEGWLTGSGLLAVHIGTYLLVGVGLLLLNLFRSPGDLWVGRPLLLWAIVLVTHASLVATRKVTRSTTRRLTPGRMRRAHPPLGPARRDRSGAIVPRPSRPRFRPTPFTPNGDAHPALRYLTARSRSLATDGLILATEGARMLILQRRELWQRQGEPALEGARGRLKAIRHPHRIPDPRPLSAVSSLTGTATGIAHPAETLLPGHGAAVVQAIQTRQPDSPPPAGVVVPRSPRDGAAPFETPASVETRDDDNATSQESPGIWGSLPSWAQIRPGTSDGVGGDSPRLRERPQPAPIHGRFRPTFSDSLPSFDLSDRHPNADDDVLIHEAPVIAKETEWTWMEAAAASWLARRERQNRPNPEPQAADEPVEATPVDPERLHA